MVLPVSTGTYRFSAGMPLMENGNYQFLLAPTVFPLACHSWKMVLPVSTGTYRFSAGMPLMENGNYQFLLAPTVFIRMIV